MADDRPDSYNVGRALQRLRKGKDWTLAAVAEKTGVAISTLSKIENNQSSPSYDVLVRLANGLNMGLMELVRARASPRSPPAPAQSPGPVAAFHMIRRSASIRL